MFIIARNSHRSSEIQFSGKTTSTVIGGMAVWALCLLWMI